MFSIVLISASSYLMQSVSTEKENRVMEVLMSSMTPTQMLAGKVLGLGLVGLIQLGLWLASALGALNFLPASFSLGTFRRQRCSWPWSSSCSATSSTPA